MDLQLAKRYANRIFEILQPHCQVIHIAGSIRREKPEVKDIEIVCIPNKIFVKTDLFGGGYYTVSASFVQAIALFSDEVIKGKPDGRMMQIRLKGGPMLDLFMPYSPDYYRQLAIRTGSSEFSQKVIASGWLKNGWCGSDNGLRLQSQCIGTKNPDGKTTWKCVAAEDQQTLPPEWKSEEDFFKWIGVEYKKPQLRNI